MHSTKFLQVVVLRLLVFNILAFEASGDVTTSPIACLNCSKCEYPCQQPSPPITYGAPPPPPPPPSGYSIYGAPPPPLPQEKDHTKCPPAAAAGVECCTPPVPYTPAPPNPYTYVPYGEGQRSTPTLLPVLVPLMMVLSSTFVLF
ncbi:hypothetical protein RJT34_13164 [Clitoria ternatea]|uniref:Uncharacterized protein n=1 Tax=Clitoria ternatea TaxID=43366 RepID=A0AAN9JQN5_CLITE